MVVIDNETEKLIKHDIDLGNIVFAGNTIAQYIESKNPHENLTLALRSIKEDLKKILSMYPGYFYLGQVSFSAVEEVLNDLGWRIKEGKSDERRQEYLINAQDNIIYKVIVSYHNIIFEKQDYVDRTAN